MVLDHFDHISKPEPFQEFHLVGVSQQMPELHSGILFGSLASGLCETRVGHAAKTHLGEVRRGTMLAFGTSMQDLVVGELLMAI